MRQLWEVGWMPNYLRHVVAGFLVELIPFPFSLVMAQPCEFFEFGCWCYWTAHAYLNAILIDVPPPTTTLRAGLLLELCLS